MKQVRVWPAGAMEALQGCFECTDLDIFMAAATDNHHTLLEEYAEFEYIKKCMEVVSMMKNIPTQTNE